MNKQQLLCLKVGSKGGKNEYKPNTRLLSRVGSVRGGRESEKNERKREREEGLVDVISLAFA